MTLYPETAALVLPPTRTLQSGVRFRAYPGSELAQALARWIGCQRVVYNGKVEEDKLFASQRRIALRHDSHAEVKTPLDQMYAQFKNAEQTPWLSEVPSQILRNGAVRWRTAKQRQLTGLAKAPVKRNSSNFNSVLITSELFRFKEWTDADGVVQRQLELGTYNNSVGVLPFTAHRSYGLPNQITLRRTGAHWWLSFSYAHAEPAGFVLRDDVELSYELNLLDDSDLAAATLGLDRNVKHNAVATSDGRFYALSELQKTRLERKAIGAKRHQRRLARAAKGSKNSGKIRRRLAAKHEYRGNVARDFSHQTSHALTTAPANDAAAPKLIVFEALKVANMTKRPKAKQDENGRWLRNGAAQKAGLNRAILASCWGSIALQVTYKAARRNTLVLKVPAAYSSQECSPCGHIHPDNRFEQRFDCQRCHYTAHADTNAGRVVAGRGIRQVRDQKVTVKKVKSVAFGRKRTQTGQELPGVPVEETVRRDEASAEVVQLAPA